MKYSLSIPGRILTKQDEFLIVETWESSWRGAVSRHLGKNNEVYNQKKGKLKNNRDAFKKDLIDYISRDILCKYFNKKINTDEFKDLHIKIIEDVSNTASAIDRKHNVLSDCSRKCCFDKNKSCPGKYKFKISASQKLLNLQLKYMWCLKFIEEPPHCPIDAKILGEAKISNVAWTRMNCIKCYKALIEEMEEKTKEYRNLQNREQSLAKWELENFPD